MSEERGKRCRDVIAIGDHMADQIAGRLAWDRESLCWREFDGSKWAEQEDECVLTDAAAHAIHSLGAIATSCSFIRDVITMARSKATRTFNASHSRVAFSNGVVDMSGERLQPVPHSPETSLIYCLDYEWGGSYVTPATDDLLNRLVGCRDERASIQAIAGLALLGDTTMHRALLIVGPPDSGKSTLLRLLNMVAGQDPNDFAPGHIFRSDREGSLERWSKRGYRLLAIDEFPADVLHKDEEPFKRMAAHSGIDMRTHSKPPISPQWRAKIAMVSNDVPLFSDRTGAIRRRLLPIRCSRSVPPEIRDPSYLERIREELPGFAHRCVMSAEGVLLRKGFPFCVHMDDFYQEIATEGDAVKAFVSDCCELGGVYEEKLSLMYDAWRRWAVRHGRNQLSDKTLCGRIKGFAPYGVRSEHRRDGAYLVGIRLKEECASEVIF